MLPSSISTPRLHDAGYSISVKSDHCEARPHEKIFANTPCAFEKKNIFSLVIPYSLASLMLTPKQF
jgi:hypothetical protein